MCLKLILNLKSHNWPPFAQVETEGETNHLSQPKHFLVGFLLTSDSKNDLKNIIWQRKTDRSQTLFHQCALSLLFIDIINLGKWLDILKNIYKSQPNCWPPFVQIETESATETPGTWGVMILSLEIIFKGIHHQNLKCHHILDSIWSTRISFLPKY